MRPGGGCAAQQANFPPLKVGDPVPPAPPFELGRTKRIDLSDEIRKIVREEIDRRLGLA